MATVSELRKQASTLGVKNYTQYKKDELTAIIDNIICPKKEEVINKSQLLRNLIDELGVDATSGRLMFIMKEKHKVTMHRSFVLTVKNKYLNA